MKTALRIKMMAEKDFPSKVIAVSDYEETDERRRGSSLAIIATRGMAVVGDIAARRTLRRSPRPPEYN
jgi:hypothetical protein